MLGIPFFVCFGEGKGGDNYTIQILLKEFVAPLANVLSCEYARYRLMLLISIVVFSVKLIRINVRISRNGSVK